MSRFILIDIEEATLEGELHNDNLFLHVEYKGEKFSPSIYKKFLRLWKKVLKALKEKGVEEVFSFITTKDAKIAKWQEMFGMTPLLETQSHVLYRRKIL